MSSFFILDPHDQIHELGLEKSLTIGRAPTNSIVLDDRIVSREHARISASDKGPVITDRKSANGITVNGRHVEAQILKHGDTIQIGKYVLYVFEGTRADALAWIHKRAASRTDQTITELSVNHPLPTDLVGDLSTLNLIPLLQSLVDHRQLGCLELTQYGLPAGKIWVANGEIVHAETPKPLEGKEALYELMGLEYAQFMFRPEAAIPRVSITGNPVAHLLEGCRRIDERQHASSQGSTPPPAAR